MCSSCGEGMRMRRGAWEVSARDGMIESADGRQQQPGQWTAWRDWSDCVACRVRGGIRTTTKGARFASPQPYTTPTPPPRRTALTCAPPAHPHARWPTQPSAFANPQSQTTPTSPHNADAHLRVVQEHRPQAHTPCTFTTATYCTLRRPGPLRSQVGGTSPCGSSVYSKATS